MTGPLLQVKNLKKYFPVSRGFGDKSLIRAVDDVSFSIEKGETLGLLGESGCGKTTVARAVLRLLEPDFGQVLFEDQDILSLSQKELRSIRPKMQIIFQDPYASLNPRLPVLEIVGRALTYHRILEPEERDLRVFEMLEKVGINPSMASRYPHEFSGSQRQRVGIARALVTSPKLVVADEPVSALDVSIQSQILNLLVELQEELGVAFLFIAHGFNVVKHVSDRIGVMYLGRIVESSSSEVLYENPLHSYTKALISAIPQIDPSRRHRRIILSGDVPNPADPPKGCRFHTRCFMAKEICAEKEPEFREAEKDHYVACHFA